MAFDLIFDAAAGVGTSTDYASAGVDTAATFDTIDGPLPVLDFGDSTNHGALFRGIMPESYDSGASTTVKWYWHGDTATGNDVKWEVYFWRLQDTTDDLESTTSFNTTGASATDTAHTSSEFAQSVSTTITNANMDSIAAGDTGSDTMSGDACLHAVKLSQT